MYLKRSIKQQMKTTILFDGGNIAVGDLIVGASSAYLLARILEADFKLLDTTIGLNDYFDISKEYTDISDINNIDLEIKYSSSDNELVKALKTINLSFLLNKTIIVRSHENFAKHLYVNPFIKNDIDVTSIVLTNVFMNVILLPKKDHLDYLKSNFNLSNTLGVHIRCDNVWGDSNSNEKRFDVTKTIYQFVKCIKCVNPENNPVLLITDNIPAVNKIFKEENINFFMIQGVPGHSCKEKICDKKKISLDLLSLGECKEVIISYWSNFSRAGVLRTLKPCYAVKPILNQPEEEFNFGLNINDGLNSDGFRIINHCELLSKDNC